MFVVWKLDRLGRNLAHLSAREGGPAGARRPGRADRHHHRGRLPRIRHLRGAGRVRAVADPRTHPGRARGRAGSRTQGRQEVRAFEGPRCGWPRSPANVGFAPSRKQPAVGERRGHQDAADDEEDDQGEQLSLRLAEVVDARADGARARCLPRVRPATNAAMKLSSTPGVASVTTSTVNTAIGEGEGVAVAVEGFAGGAGRGPHDGCELGRTGLLRHAGHRAAGGTSDLGHGHRGDVACCAALVAAVDAELPVTSFLPMTSLDWLNDLVRDGGRAAGGRRTVQRAGLRRGVAEAGVRRAARARRRRNAGAADGARAGGARDSSRGACWGAWRRGAWSGPRGPVLYEVEGLAPARLGAAVVVLAAVALVAAYVPARRASRIDPRTALRYL